MSRGDWFAGLHHTQRTRGLFEGRYIGSDDNHHGEKHVDDGDEEEEAGVAAGLTAIRGKKPTLSRRKILPQSLHTCTSLWGTLRWSPQWNGERVVAIKDRVQKAAASLGQVHQRARDTTCLLLCVLPLMGWIPDLYFSYVTLVLTILDVSFLCVFCVILQSHWR